MGLGKLQVPHNGAAEPPFARRSQGAALGLLVDWPNKIVMSTTKLPVVRQNCSVDATLASSSGAQ